MNKNNLAFAKINYLICGAAIFLILFGFILMTGPATTFPEEAVPESINGFQPDIFSTRRTVVAPMISFFGFLLMIAGILFPTKEKDTTTAKA